MTYLKFISSAFQRSAAYRLEYYTGLFNAFLYIFIFTSVWKSVWRANPGALPGWSEDKLVQYAILSTLIKVSFGRNENLISNKVKTGDIVYDFLKPFSFPLMYLSDCLGVSLFQMFARALPLLGFSILFFGISPEISGDILLRFIPVYINGLFLFFIIGLIISSLSFFFTETFTFYILNSALITLLSGSVIPLNLYPDFLIPYITKTPFPYLFYFPTAIMIQAPLPLPYHEIIFNAILQTGILSLIAWFVFSRGKQKLEFAGG